MAACETDEVSGNIVDAGLGTDAAVQQPSADMMNDAGPSRLDGLVPNTGDECTPDKSAYEQTIRPILTALRSLSRRDTSVWRRGPFA